MKKPLLRVKGNFVLGVFVVDKIYISDKIANHELNKHLNLKVGWLSYSYSDTCGGVVKPEDPKGQAGFWDCVNGFWVWIPA